MKVYRLQFTTSFILLSLPHTHCSFGEGAMVENRQKEMRESICMLLINLSQLWIMWLSSSVTTYSLKINNKCYIHNCKCSDYKSICVNTVLSARRHDDVKAASWECAMHMTTTWHSSNCSNLSCKAEEQFPVQFMWSLVSHLAALIFMHICSKDLSFHEELLCTLRLSFLTRRLWTWQFSFKENGNTKYDISTTTHRDIIQNSNFQCQKKSSWH